MTKNQYNIKARSYATSRFKVTIDDYDITAFVKNVDGGLIKADSVEEKSGVTNAPLHHASTRSIEPITLEIGMCDNSWVLDLLSAVINNRSHKRVKGQIDYGDANYNIRFSHEFKEALITEITLPTFDPSAKDAAYIKVKLQPETADFGTGSGKIETGKMAATKMWQPNAFRLEIEQNGRTIDCSKTTKVESMTFKIGGKPAAQGPRQLPAYMPTLPTLPKLSFHLPLHGAESAINWYRDAIAKTVSDRSDGTGYEATGTLVLLDQNRTKDLYHFDFAGLGPEQLAIVKGEGGATNLKTCKLDLYMSGLKVGRG